MSSSPILLTPGPLTTRPETRAAMQRDWGSRDQAFIAMTASLRRGLLEIANGSGSHVAVPLQGSGTFIVEATLGTLVGPADKLLVLVNGAYGERMMRIMARLGRRAEALSWPENQPVDPARLDEVLAGDAEITHVALVHCETTTGILNPLEAVGQVVAARGRQLLVDAMSSFGALPIDLQRTPAAAVMASSNKCLEGVPGIGFALIGREAIEAAKGNSPSLAFDLHDQWQGFEKNGQWRFTPPVQVVAALVEALEQLGREGGPEARRRRYQAHFDYLADEMTRLGFSLFLERARQAPIIVTFHQPTEPWFDFQAFYEALAAKGFLIYPGKLSQADTFRIGCIGAIDLADFRRFMHTVEAILAECKKSRRLKKGRALPSSREGSPYFRP